MGVILTLVVLSAMSTVLRSPNLVIHAIGEREWTVYRWFHMAKLELLTIWSRGPLELEFRIDLKSGFEAIQAVV